MLVSTCRLSTKQTVAISGNLKARRRLGNKGIFATNSNVLRDVALGEDQRLFCSVCRFNEPPDFCQRMFAMGHPVRRGGHVKSLH